MEALHRIRILSQGNRLKINLLNRQNQASLSTFDLNIRLATRTRRLRRNKANKDRHIAQKSNKLNLRIRGRLIRIHTLFRANNLSLMTRLRCQKMSKVGQGATSLVVILLIRLNEGVTATALSDRLSLRFTIINRNDSILLQINGNSTNQQNSIPDRNFTLTTLTRVRSRELIMFTNRRSTLSIRRSLNSIFLSTQRDNRLVRNAKGARKNRNDAQSKTRRHTARQITRHMTRTELRQLSNRTKTLQVREFLNGDQALYGGRYNCPFDLGSIIRSPIEQF